MTLLLENTPGCSYTLGPAFSDYPKSYRCHLAILQEEGGGFSAIVLNLPGAASCGDTEAQAIVNVSEAVAGAIESYIAHSEAIPWQDCMSYALPEGAKTKWILVDA